MRLVQTKHLKQGDIIAKDIVSSSGGILLRENTRFREVFKSKMLERGILEVYVDDEISKGIEPEEILSITAKKKIRQDIKWQFDKLKDSLAMDTDTISDAATIMMDQLRSRDIILELDDLKANDNYTYEHCIAVAILTNIVCNRLNIAPDMTEQIVMGALMHDIGKIIMPKDILNKPSKLTKEEYALIKTHAEVGYKMIKDDPEVSAITKLVVLCHHEREDGSGYPLGKGEELHISAKIVAACDLFHALISDRCYRKGLPINEVIAIADKQPINPEIRTIIENTFCFYPVGSIVMLNNGKLGIVEKNFNFDIKNPLIRLVDKVDDHYISKCEINLSKEKHLYIIARYNGELN